MVYQKETHRNRVVSSLLCVHCAPSAPCPETVPTAERIFPPSIPLENALMGELIHNQSKGSQGTWKRTSDQETTAACDARAVTCRHNARGPAGDAACLQQARRCHRIPG
ncbi:hypothetical protein BV20DRAFT_400876 [Pilatotrama ljubarskyi]|nr:hypothetical protein BV20DRAFT_400876 [Pilatotrama ljubarskyi]